ncbi:conserved hypothetical protein [Cellulomonas flavigena DSM 20109]|uniref:Polysaccharide pyruvyl transferase domain-containing protein n=1 Tax=Cellulomonas flavigena (strain ATCC 482 / DSM 20109 / BCRC 11376 / JCM 18109 / NBRC 3775 / NCIMB 8073 / NRS 134) TaxID=446466 RepID=D5UJC5_CELFN|nr:polysaccharide pyruvyl transferase family protein [Cellulomonas flavigena]ADG73648.1 conserved hypothetical protein [Cellulomonas flavigena DSM 20109]
MDVLVSAVGQHDNIGDTVLRRAYLDEVRPLGRLHVFVGDKPDGYVAGLGLHPTDVVHRSPGSWRASVRDGLLAGSFYGFDSGETEVRRAYARRYARLAPLLALNRARGGAAVQAGTGVRADHRWRVPIAAVLRLCDVVTWRDAYSRDLMGVGDVAPDWAFALGPDAGTLRAGTDRPLLAVSVRQGTGDVRREPPDASWARRVRALADGLGVTPVVVTQVARDAPLGDRVAHDLRAEHLTWDGHDHAAQEARLRKLYRRCSHVLSDRLHVVVVAATEGAVPVGLATPTALGEAPDKVVRTLRAAGITGTCLPHDLPDVEGAVARLARVDRDTVVDAVLDSRARLVGLGERLRAAGGQSSAASGTAA